MKKLPIVKLTIGEEELEMIREPLKTGWIVQGPYVQEFERTIARFVGAKYAVAVNSCTSGQFIMSRIVGLKPGDEVIVPSFTWISTANSIEFLGAKAVFCDVDLTTYNIDVRQIEEKITDRTRAIYPVHLFGLAANMPQIKKMAERHGLQVVEDCACGLGAKIGDTHCGLFGLGGILSFHPRKSISTGEGGMVITNEERVAAMTSSLRDHGGLKSDFERHTGKAGFLLTEYEYLGYNFRMTDIQGALGVAQCRRLEWILSKKKEIAREYTERLRAIPWLKAPEIPEGYTHGYQTYCTLFKPEETWKAIRDRDVEKIRSLSGERNRVMADLEMKGIATRQGTHAVHIQKYYREKYGLQPMDFPASYAADLLTVALPFYPTLSEEDIEYLFHHLKNLNV